MRKLFALLLLTLILSGLSVTASAETVEVPVTVNPAYAHIQAPEDVVFDGPVAPATLADPVYASQEAATLAIREYLTAWTGEFTVYVTVPRTADTNLKTVFRDLFYGAMEHTGQPTQGDYLKRHYSGFKGSYSYYTYPDRYDVAFTYVVGYYTSAEQEMELTDAVETLLTELDLSAKTPYEKVKSVYDYMTHNIDYDYDGLADDTDMLEYTAYNALINGKAVCQGYANLFYRLSLTLGVDCRLISGNADNGVSVGGHAWNIVKLGNTYFNLDATWDEPRADYGMEYDYFLLGSTEFYADHYSDPEFLSDEFLAVYPISETDYVPYIAQGTCGSNLTWTLSGDGTLTISGTGEMNSYSSYPWYNYRSSIKNIVVADGVTSIGKGAFSGCSGLESITIPFVGGSRKTANDTYQYPFGYIFGTSSYTGGTKTYQYYYGSSTTNLTYNYYYIPSGLKHVTVTGGDILYGAFYNCSGLTVVTIPDSVTSIGYSAFYNCTSLTGVTIPDSVTSIAKEAFWACTSLTSVTIPDSVTSIGNGVFRYCTGLTSVTIGDSVTSIGKEAFYKCTSLTSVTIGDSVTSINGYAFYECTSLTSVTIPNSVTSIGEGAFSGCSGLESITIPFVGGSRKTAEDTYQYPFGYIFGTSSYTGGTETSQFYYGSSTTSLIASHYYIPSGLKQVTVTGGELLCGAFNNCDSLTGVTICNGVTSIGEYGFYECTSLTSVTIPDSVTSIGDAAFSDCSNLKHVAYGGTQAQWNQISISSSNDYLTGAKRHYEATPTDVLYYTKNCVNSGLFCDVCGFITTENATNGSHTYDGDKDMFCDDCEYTRTIKAITVSTKPSVVKFDLFTGVLNVAGGRIKVIYSDDTTGYVDMTADMVTDFDNSKPGSQTLTVTYGGKSATYSVEIVAGTPERLEIVTLPEQLYYLVGQTPDLTGIVAKAIYPQGEAEISADQLTMDDVTLLAGKQTVTVRFKGVPVSYTVIVHELSMVVIDSSIYPESSHDYASNTNETKTFTYPGAGQLVLTFSSDSFAENNYDFVYVLDKNGVQIAKLTGSLSGKVVTVPGDTVQIKLTSDGSVNKYGYAFSSIVAETILHPEVITPATVTCTEAGMTAGAKCEICDMVLVEPQPAQALGHNFVDGVCTNCGAGNVTITVPGVGSFSGLEDAIAAYDPAGGYIRLDSDVVADLTLTKDLKLDLNGYRFTGVIRSNGFKVYGIDSTTDGYTCQNAGVFNCVDADGAAVVPVSNFKTTKAVYGAIKRYLTVPEADGGYSFHRFYFAITHRVLQPGRGGIGYKAVFAGDEAVKGYLDADCGFGLVLSVSGKPESLADGICAGFEADKFMEDAPVTKTVLLQNVLRPGLTLAEQEERADRMIYACSFLQTKGGEVILSAAESDSFRDIVEAVDRHYNTYTDDQKLLLLNFCNAYGDLLKKWDISNMLPQAA